jgi:hypothetical protein
MQAAQREVAIQEPLIASRSCGSHRTPTPVSRPSTTPLTEPRPAARSRRLRACTPLHRERPPRIGRRSFAGRVSDVGHYGSPSTVERYRHVYGLCRREITAIKNNTDRIPFARYSVPVSPASLTALLHLTASDFSKSPNSSGVDGLSSNPCAKNRFFTSGSVITFRNSALRRSIMG